MSNRAVLPDTLLDPSEIAEVEMETEPKEPLDRGSVPAEVEHNETAVLDSTAPDPEGGAETATDQSQEGGTVVPKPESVQQQVSGGAIQTTNAADVG